MKCATDCIGYGIGGRRYFRDSRASRGQPSSRSCRRAITPGQTPGDAVATVLIMTDTKNHTATASGSLEGRVFRPTSQQDLAEAIELAFDYRGDVTLELTSESRWRVSVQP